MSEITPVTSAKKSKTKMAFAISLALLFLCSILNWGLVTDLGKIRVTQMTLVGDDGMQYTAYVYAPRSATNDDPAPALFTIMGLSGNGRTHESWALEFARRGYVVMSVDNMGSGDSEFSQKYNTFPRVDECVYFYEYLLKMPIVDTDHIIVSGHSLGSNGARCLASRYNAYACIQVDGIMQESLAEDPFNWPYGGNQLVLIADAGQCGTDDMIILYTGTFGLSKLLGDQNFALFDGQRSNRAFAVMIGLCVVGLITMLLFIFTDAKKQGATIREFGLTSEGHRGLDFKLIGKAFLLALCVLAFGFGYLRLQRNVLGTDFFTFGTFGLRPIAWNKAANFIPYILVWMFCFMISAISMCVERRLPSTGSEAKDTAIAVVLNAVLASVTVMVAVMVQYQANVVVGRSAPMSNNIMDWGADLTRLWGMPWGMLIGAGGNTYLYRKTGTIWTGAFLMGTICALMCVMYGQFRLGIF